MSKKVLFHSFGNGHHCPDGFAAAWVAHTIFGDSGEYIPCVYQQPPPAIETGDQIYLVDFSYPRHLLSDWATLAYVGGKVVVLDHHKTAQADLSQEIAGVETHFDMSKSGAQLAWEYWRPSEPEPLLISYVADRDLWHKELPRTEEVHRALQSFRQNFEVWDALAAMPDYVDYMTRVGAPLYAAHLVEVEALARTAVPYDFMGYPVMATTTDNLSLVSETLNLICKEHPEAAFAVNHSMAEGGKVRMELRSVGDFDVSAVAKQLGGGGHRNAAGCMTDASDPRIAILLKQENWQ